jgi:threonine aldolase
MNFASDNTGPVHPRVMAALARANEGHAMPYGADALTAEVTARVRAVFEAPAAEVFLVATGTAANALILATLGVPWSVAFCHRTAHVQEDECGAPEFLSGGMKLALVDGPDGKIDPGALAAAIAAEGTRGVHGPARGPVTLTQATEKGTVYSLAETGRLAAVAHGFGLPVHMDGARLANALVALGCTPAEATWKAGVDALSLGGTKNGLMGVEAAVFFDPALARAFDYRRKRSAHLFSKQRYLAAQMAAYLEDGLWLRTARAANAAMARLAAGLAAHPEVRILYPPQANILFAAWPRRLHRRLIAAGARYYLWSGAPEGPDDEPLTARLVTGWSTTADEIDRFLALFTE